MLVMLKQARWMVDANARSSIRPAHIGTCAFRWVYQLDNMSHSSSTVSRLSSIYSQDTFSRLCCECLSIAHLNANSISYSTWGETCRWRPDGVECCRCTEISMSEKCFWDFIALRYWIHSCSDPQSQWVYPRLLNCHLQTSNCYQCCSNLLICLSLAWIDPQFNEYYRWQRSPSPFDGPTSRCRPRCFIRYILRSRWFWVCERRCGHVQ